MDTATLIQTYWGDFLQSLPFKASVRRSHIENLIVSILPSLLAYQRLLRHLHKLTLKVLTTDVPLKWRVKCNFLVNVERVAFLLSYKGLLLVVYRPQFVASRFTTDPGK